MVEDVEEFRAELEAEALGEARVLGGGEVNVDETGADEGIALDVAEGSRVAEGERLRG